MKKNTKRIFVLALTSLLLLAGCGSTEENKEGQQEPATSADKNVIVIGASPEPHASILEKVKPILKEEGIDVEIKTFTDYIIPNTALEEKELDANFFQHQPYLEEFNEQRGTHLISAGNVHVEPMGVYSKSINALENLKEGAKIAIPNDPTNGGRALLLLEKEGLITLKSDAGLAATDRDIEDNPKKLKFEFLEAAQLPRALEDVDAAVINTNYALEADLNPIKDAIAMEGKESPYANIIAIREEDKGNENIEALINALNSEEIKTFIEEEYKGAIIPAF